MSCFLLKRQLSSSSNFIINTYLKKASKINYKPTNVYCISLSRTNFRSIIPQRPISHNTRCSINQKKLGVFEEKKDIDSSLKPILKHEIPPISNTPKSDTLFTIPNMLTMSRIAATPFIGYFVLHENYMLAGSLFVYSCITDFLDGYIARKFHMKSSAGTILDPAADKLLMLVTTLSFTLPPGPQIVPIGVASFIIGRDILLLLNSFFVRYKTLKGKFDKITQEKFWDFYHYPSVEVQPTRISKWNTFFQMCYLGPGVILVLLAFQKENSENENSASATSATEAGQNKKIQEKDEMNAELPQKRPDWFTYFGYFVALTSVLSGFSYIGPAKYSKMTVKILK
ncbi:hypothetical protein ACO0RG_004264 [Hanseniaspora osmophila]